MSPGCHPAGVPAKNRSRGIVAIPRLSSQASVTGRRCAMSTAGMLFTSNVHQYGASKTANSQIPSMVRSHRIGPRSSNQKPTSPDAPPYWSRSPEPYRRQPPHERARAHARGVQRPPRVERERGMEPDVFLGARPVGVARLAVEARVGGDIRSVFFDVTHGAGHASRKAFPVDGG